MKLLSALLLLCLAYQTNGNQEREGRFLSLFNSVNFKNEECKGTSSDSTGVCLSLEECNQMNGVNLGTCAAGFGTCCQRTTTECGSRVTGNCTYIQNKEYPERSTEAQNGCVFELVRMSEDICFLRLDFVKFEVALPDKIADGVKGECTIDSASYTQGNGYFAPVVCGKADGQHMYLDAGGPTDNKPITITHKFTGTTQARVFRYKVTQIPCGTPTTPWQGCLQYFTGLTGRLENFNFEGGHHLVEHYYAICIRQEEKRCFFTVTPSEKPNSFKLENAARNMVGNSGSFKCSNDFLQIPRSRNLGTSYCRIQFEDVVGPVTPASLEAVVAMEDHIDRFCGGSLNCISMGNTERETVISEAGPPFNIYVNFDQKDPKNDGENNGFSLDYLQLPC